MTARQFAVMYSTFAKTVSVGTGLRPVVLLAQWGVETGWGTTWAGAPNNLANIECGPGIFCRYLTLSDFCDACVATWHNGNYSSVLATAGAGPTAQAIAIGESPWDAGHYVGLPPYNYRGGSIIQAIGAIQMGTVADLDQAWLTDAGERLASFLGVTSGPTAPVTAEQLLAAIKAIQSPPPANVNLQPVLDALAAVTAKVIAIEAKIDKDLA